MIVFLAVVWPVLWYFLTMEFFIDVPADADVGPIKAANGMNYGLFGAFTVTVAVFAGEFARDLDGERYRKFRTMPVSPSADLVGRFLAGFLLGVGSYLMTIGVAYAHGGSFGGLGVQTVAVIALTLALFCLIAMALAMGLAIVITKPEHMTTIAVVAVLMAFFVTGYNGTAPSLIAQNAEMVNYLPNSLATRMQIAVWAGAENVEFMTPPEAPVSASYAGILAGYAAVLSATSFAIIKQFGYGGVRR
ncbi:ABC transporter permease [Natronobiforma cellulositropha]